MNISQKRKKKKRKMEQKKIKHFDSIHNAYSKRYPNLCIYHTGNADINLVNEIEKVCKKYDFRKCDSNTRLMFEDHKKLPHKKFLKKYIVNYNEKENESLDNGYVDFYSIAADDHCKYVPYVYLENQLLLFLYKHLKESGFWSQYMPTQNIMIKSFRGDFVIFVRSFYRHRSSFGNGYFTEKRIFLEIPTEEDGEKKRYQVAISEHALQRSFERVFKRTSDKDLDSAKYPMLIYQFGLYNEYRLVKKGDEWLVAVYATYKHGPEDINSFPHRVAFEILDRTENFKFLCGYCPIGFCKDDFIHLTTLLSPGMKGTPEKTLIDSIKEKDIRKKYESLLSNSVVTDDYLEMLKFFQNAGYHIVEYLTEKENKNE